MQPIQNFLDPCRKKTDKNMLKIEENMLKTGVNVLKVDENIFWRYSEKSNNVEKDEHT